jgi:hypothetical protein
MKAKKLVFNKKTVANLSGVDMISARGGANTIYSCAISETCPTDFLYCTERRCECTDLCTLPCPISLYDCDTDYDC